MRSEKTSLPARWHVETGRRDKETIHGVTTVNALVHSRTFFNQLDMVGISAILYIQAKQFPEAVEETGLVRLCNQVSIMKTGMAIGILSFLLFLLLLSASSVLFPIKRSITGLVPASDHDYDNLRKMIRTLEATGAFSR